MGRREKGRRERGGKGRGGGILDFLVQMKYLLGFNKKVNYVQIMCILNVYWNAQLCVNHMPFYVFNERAHYVQILCMLHVE